MKTIIHIGYPKTASTYLQAIFSNNSDQFNYIGKKPVLSGVGLDGDLLWVEQSILLNSELEFERNLGKIVDILAGKFLERDGCNVFSHEGFLRATRYFKEFPQGRDVKETLRRLKLTFGQLGDLEYMIVVRNHVDLIFSYYNFFSHVMKYYGLDVRTLNKVLKGGRADASFIIDNFRFGEVAEYASQFSDGLHVLFYEDFVDDKKGFLASVQERIGCEFEPASIPESRLNVSKDASSAKSSSFFDRFLRKKTYNLSESWKLEMIDVVKKYYRNDLKKLELITGKNKLITHGYL
jgi:hypothetical protein